MNTLEWRTQDPAMSYWPGAEVIRVAKGRYHDWSYILLKLPTDAGEIVWEAWFVDSVDKQLLERGNFIQARKACIDHHSREGGGGA